KVKPFMYGFCISNFGTLSYEPEKNPKIRRKDFQLNNANSSTLSLYIAAYENSNETSHDSFITKNDAETRLNKYENVKKWESLQQPILGNKNCFEFPRQQDDRHAIQPEVMQFTASQRLLNPNDSSPSTNRKTMSKQEKQDIVRRWKEGYLETKPNLKGGYVQILDNKKVMGHICIHCEKYFIGGNIGGKQRDHECVKKSPTFSTSQKQIAKEASLKMIKTDLLPFAVVYKPGLLGFATAMLEIGAELGPQVVKNVTIDDVKSLLPHPTTLSNHINDLSLKKPQLYSILKRKSSDSGISLMIDGTSKTFHYTGIHISFIDENWKFSTLLTDLISGHGKGESTSAYVSEKSLNFLKDFGVDVSLVNAFITDEAASMVSAFANTDRLIVCACHMIWTISKHCLVLYAKDKADQPILHQSLQIVCGMKKKLKEVITAIRSRIYINKIITHPLYQSNETRFLSFITSVDSFLSLSDEDHKIIDAGLTGHTVYPSYLELVEASNDLKTIYNVLYPTMSVLRTLEVFIYLYIY
uniref:Transposase n=1 Tax=Panagrolaimus sp. ES5 TaxID=591445 RepID=A0AC34G7V4_9BILA